MNLKLCATIFFGAASFFYLFSTYTVNDLRSAIRASDYNSVVEILEEDETLAYEVHNPCIFCYLLHKPYLWQRGVRAASIEERTSDNNIFRYLHQKLDAICLCFEDEKRKLARYKEYCEERLILKAGQDIEELNERYQIVNYQYEEFCKIRDKRLKKKRCHNCCCF